MFAQIARHVRPRHLTADALRVAANPDGTRYVIAEGDHANVILTSDRRALRAHLHAMLATSAPDDLEREVIAAQLWAACLAAITAELDDDGDDQAPVADITIIDIVCDGTLGDRWYPHTVSAHTETGSYVGGFSADDHLTDSQLDDLTDLGGPFRDGWTLTLRRPTP